MKYSSTLAAGHLLSASAGSSATIDTFTGGDIGEGLDLDGSFAYAINVSNNANGAGPDDTARDATFRDEFSNGPLIPGVTALASAVVARASNAPATPGGGLDATPILSAVTLEAIPEPSGVLLAAFGFAACVLRRHR